VCHVFKKPKSFKAELQERDYCFEKPLEAMLQDVSSPEIIPDMSWPEMLSATNSAAAAGCGEGMSCSYGRGNSFPAIQNMTLQGEAHHHQHQGPVGLAATLKSHSSQTKHITCRICSMASMSIDLMIMAIMNNIFIPIFKPILYIILKGYSILFRFW
jgi:hypothetical protein